MGVGMAGINSDGAVIARHCFLDTANTVQRESAIIPGSSTTWIRRQTPLETGERFLRKIQFLQGHAAIVPNISVLGCNRERLIVTGQCVFGPAEMLKCDSLIIPSFGVTRLGSKRGGETHQGLLVTFERL